MSRLPPVRVAAGYARKAETERLKDKLIRLKNYLRRFSGVIVAFSGGVDSSLLLAVARSVLGDRVIAATAVSPLYPKAETKLAIAIAESLKVRHILIKSREMKKKEFTQNPRHRCYHCKRELFRKIRALGRKSGFLVIEASNKSDLGDYRPGRQAAAELGVASPLVAAGIGKSEVRMLARSLGLPNWNKPSMACLASRIPYGNVIDARTVRRIGKAELFLTARGYGQLRVRDHYPVARIEVLPAKIKSLLMERTSVAAYFKKIGYKYVTVDLEGYQTGSMNR